jgi:hypothetical protein
MAGVEIAIDARRKDRRDGLSGRDLVMVLAPSLFSMGGAECGWLVSLDRELPPVINL